MTVAVVIPTYNRCQLLCEATRSCLRQSAPPRQIIVDDDASTDGTAEDFPRWLVENGFVEETTAPTPEEQASSGRSGPIPSRRVWHRQLSSGHQVTPFTVRVDFLRQPINRGAAAARNEGLRHVQCDLVAFLDSDDLLVDDSLKRRVDFLGDNPEFGLVFGDSLHLDANGQKVGQSFFDYFGIRDRLQLQPAAGGWRIENAFAALLHSNEILTPQVMVRMACIRGIEWFDEKLRVAEDHECWTRWATRFPFGMIDSVVALVRLDAGNQLTRNNRATWDAAQVYVERKRLRELPLSAHQRRETRRRYAKALFDLAYLQLRHQHRQLAAMVGFIRSFAARPSFKSLRGVALAMLSLVGLIRAKSSRSLPDKDCCCQP